MHTTELGSVTLIHDGDFTGPMYAVTPEAAIIVTSRFLETAATMSGLEPVDFVSLQGPDREMYDRDQVTDPKDPEALLPGNWKTATIRVRQGDLETALTLKRTSRLIDLLEQFDGQGRFPESAAVLDGMIAQLETKR